MSIQIIERPTSVDAETSIKKRLYNHGSRMEASENANSMTTLSANPAHAMRLRCLDRKRFETRRLTTMDTRVIGPSLSIEFIPTTEQALSSE
jgi:hypothetical protein